MSINGRCRQRCLFGPAAGGLLVCGLIVAGLAGCGSGAKPEDLGANRLVAERFVNAVVERRSLQDARPFVTPGVYEGLQEALVDAAQEEDLHVHGRAKWVAPCRTKEDFNDKIADQCYVFDLRSISTKNIVGNWRYDFLNLYVLVDGTPPRVASYAAYGGGKFDCDLSPNIPVCFYPHAQDNAP